MSFTAVHVPEFPAAVWQRYEPELRLQPLAVIEGAPPQERVVSCNRHAKAAGVRHGMSKVQTEAAGQVQFRRRQIELERSTYALALEIAERFSPRVEAIASPANGYQGSSSLSAVLLLDSSGTGTLFGSIESFAGKLRAALTEAGLPAGIGAAPNGQAALMLARSGRVVICAGREDVRAKLAPLSVSLLPCEPKAQAVLARWGIRTLGEFAALPGTALVSRLGQEGHHLQQLARGEADHLLVPEEPQFTLTETTALDVAVDLLDSLLFVVSPMLDAVLRKAIERAYALRSVRLTLQLERGDPHRIAIRPAVPTQNREVLLKLLHLELQACPPRAGILTVTLDAEAAQPQTAQRGLFQAQFPDPSRLDLLLARLRAIAGNDTVGSPVLRNTHREDAFSMGPFQPRPRASGERDPLPSRLAIRLCRPPQFVRVVCEEEQPRTLFWQDSRLDLTLCAGPWHTSGSWWDGRAWDSDMWDVVTAAPAQALRLRLDHATGAWSVVGLYD